jgi:thiamine biosynthesis lipoprotein
LQRIVALTDEAMATSGDYRNFFEHEGIRYSHTIDPTTGRPVEHSLATVTVRAATCMEADALATAILVMGPERGFVWAEKQGVAALLVERREDNYHEQMTIAWERTTRAADNPQESSGWQTFVVAAIVFALAITGMAIGVILKGRRIRGSCGGIANFRNEAGETACELCRHPSPDCTGNPEEREPADSL